MYHSNHHPIADWMQFGMLPFLLWGGAAQLVTTQLEPRPDAAGSAVERAPSSTATIIDLAAYRERRFGQERRRQRIYARAAWQEW